MQRWPLKKGFNLVRTSVSAGTGKGHLQASTRLPLEVDWSKIFEPAQNNDIKALTAEITSLKYALFPSIRSIYYSTIAANIASKCLELSQFSKLFGVFECLQRSDPRSGSVAVGLLELICRCSDERRVDEALASFRYMVSNCKDMTLDSTTTERLVSSLVVEHRLSDVIFVLKHTNMSSRSLCLLSEPFIMGGYHSEYCEYLEKYLSYKPPSVEVASVLKSIMMSRMRRFLSHTKCSHQEGGGIKQIINILMNYHWQSMIAAGGGLAPLSAREWPSFFVLRQYYEFEREYMSLPSFRDEFLVHIGGIYNSNIVTNSDSVTDSGSSSSSSSSNSNVSDSLINSITSIVAIAESRVGLGLLPRFEMTGFPYLVEDREAPNQTGSHMDDFEDDYNDIYNHGRGNDAEYSNSNINSRGYSASSSLIGGYARRNRNTGGRMGRHFRRSGSKEKSSVASSSSKAGSGRRVKRGVKLSSFLRRRKPAKLVIKDLSFSLANYRSASPVEAQQGEDCIKNGAKGKSTNSARRSINGLPFLLFSNKLFASSYRNEMHELTKRPDRADLLSNVMSMLNDKNNSGGSSDALRRLGVDMKPGGSSSILKDFGGKFALTEDDFQISISYVDVEGKSHSLRDSDASNDVDDDESDTNNRDGEEEDDDDDDFDDDDFDDDDFDDDDDDDEFDDDEEEDDDDIDDHDGDMDISKASRVNSAVPTGRTSSGGRGRTAAAGGGVKNEDNLNDSLDKLLAPMLTLDENLTLLQTAMRNLGHDSTALKNLRKTRNFPFVDLTQSLFQHYGDVHLYPDVSVNLDLLGASAAYEDFYDKGNRKMDGARVGSKKYEQDDIIATEEVQDDKETTETAKSDEKDGKTTE